VSRAGRCIRRMCGEHLPEPSRVEWLDGCNECYGAARPQPERRRLVVMRTNRSGLTRLSTLLKVVSLFIVVALVLMMLWYVREAPIPYKFP